jgi:hypothetical protein
MTGGKGLLSWAQQTELIFFSKPFFILHGRRQNPSCSLNVAFEPNNVHRSKQRCNYITVVIFPNSSLILKQCGPHETEIRHDRQHLMIRRVTFYTMFGYRAQSECDEDGKVGEEVGRNKIRENDGE